MSEAAAITAPGERQGARRISPLAPPKGVALVRAWLLVIACMVYAMILVGGATRLTDSGLTITEWRPLLGAIPPMTGADWADAFAKYQLMTAQYHQLNPNMDLAAFKGIYWWEWSHRELGRAIGVIFALPLIFFWLTGRTTKKLLPHLLILFALGGLQGLIGWWMVASGVNTDLTSVAPYRLMTHFCLALLIIAYCFWLWLELGPAQKQLPREASGWSSALLWIVGVQMALGALVAGLDAGRGYIDWPLMSGEFVPAAIFALDPVWRNVFENEATTQFFHRMTAYLLFAISLYTAWRFRKEGPTYFPLFAGLVSAQAALGVVTLVNAAPLNLSLLHQALGTVVLLAGVRLAWNSTEPRHAV
jgi:cytochrome c oxidase assembly protein subunit 15